LKPIEIKALTLLEFNMVLEGYVAREQEEWDRTRTVMSYIRTFAGMGASKYWTPEEILGLHKDKAFKVRPIRTYAEAMDLLNSFSVN